MKVLSQPPSKPAMFNLLTECAFGFGIGIWNIAFNFHLKLFGFSSAEIGMLFCRIFINSNILIFAAGSDKIGFHGFLL